MPPVDPNDMVLEDLDDEDIIVVNEVYLDICKRRQGRRLDLEDFRREAIERFRERSIKVDVRTWIGEGDDFVSWELLIEGKIVESPLTYEGFDHEKQADLVQRDVLGISEKGKIDESGLWRPS